MNEENGGDLLSQDEIDNLMNNKQPSISGEERGDASSETDSGNNLLDEKDKDILGEIGNIALGSSATALYTLLDKEVNITTPRVNVTTFNELSNEYEKPCVLVKVNYIKGLKGFNILIINEQDAKIIADLMMGGEGTDDDLELDEIRLSSIEEAMNQMMGSASTSMSSIIDREVNISPPEAEFLDIEDVFENQQEYYSEDDSIIAISFQLQIGSLVDSSFKQVLSVDFARQLISEIGGEDEGLVAKEGKEEVEEITENEKEVKEEKEIKPESKKESKTISKQDSYSKAKEQKMKSDNSSKREEVGVKTAQFPSFEEKEEQTIIPKNMNLIKDVPLEVTVRLGETTMTVKEVLDLGEGSLIELDKMAGEPVDLYVNGKLIAEGEVVVIDENFGFRVKNIIEPMARINQI